MKNKKGRLKEIQKEKQKERKKGMTVFKKREKQRVQI